MGSRRRKAGTNSRIAFLLGAGLA